MNFKEFFKIYILPFIVLTILIQFHSAFKNFTLYNQMREGSSNNKEKVKVIKNVLLTRTAISVYSGSGKTRSLLHFALPDYSMDLTSTDDYKFEVIPKGTPFQLVDDGNSGSGSAILKKGNQLYFFKTSREEYGIYKETKKRVYDGTMKEFLNQEYDRYAQDLEAKLLAGKLPIRISQCFAPFDSMYGRNLSHYNGSKILYQILLDNYFQGKQNLINKFGLKDKIKIVNSYTRPIEQPHNYLFCSQLEFNDLRAYVVFQNLPSLE